MTRRPEDETPTEQLQRWRSWRDDTAEFPAVQDEILEPPRRSRRRFGVGFLSGIGIVAAAMIFSGLAALGVGPVRELLGSDGGGSAHPAPSSSAPSSGAASSGGASSAPSSGGASTAPSMAPSTDTAVTPTDAPSPSDVPTDGPGQPKPPKRGGPGAGGGPAAPPSGGPAGPAGP